MLGGRGAEAGQPLVTFWSSDEDPGPKHPRQQRVLNVGGGGGARMIVSGFTVAGISRVKVVGTDWPARVELTRPWRPVEDVRIRAVEAGR